MLIDIYIIVLIIIHVDKVISAYILGWMVQGRPNTIEHHLKMKTNILPIFLENTFNHRLNNSHLNAFVVDSFTGNQVIDNRQINKQVINDQKIINQPDSKELGYSINHQQISESRTIVHQENNHLSNKSNDLASIGLLSDDKLKCKVNSDCLSIKNEMYCDNHYGICRQMSQEGELCRIDEHCDHDMICIFGKCAKPKEVGKLGSRCLDDSDCDSDNCCARLLGFKICKPRLKLHQKCFIPYGGLDYSLNESCPCMNGLVCEPIEHVEINSLIFKKLKPKNPKIEHLRCTV